MELNSDCVRDILLTAEENEGMCYPGKYPLLDKYDEEVVVYHINQCHMNDLILKKVYTDDEICIPDLTPKGHDYLANIRNSDIWAKTKELGKELGCKSLNALISLSSQIIATLIRAKFNI